MKRFEERLSRLEEISDKIKEADIPLEDAVSLFEEGIKLAKKLEAELSSIERRIEILTNYPEKDDEKPELELFPELNNNE